MSGEQIPDSGRVDPMLELILGMAVSNGWPQEAIDTVRELRRQRDDARVARASTPHDAAGPGDLPLPNLVRLYASQWVPEDSSERTRWTLSQCSCDPAIEHCESCDLRRLACSLVRRFVPAQIDGSGA